MRVRACIPTHPQLSNASIHAVWIVLAVEITVQGAQNLSRNRVPNEPQLGRITHSANQAIARLGGHRQRKWPQWNGST